MSRLPFLVRRFAHGGWAIDAGWQDRFLTGAVGGHPNRATPSGMQGRLNTAGSKALLIAAGQMPWI